MSQAILDRDLNECLCVELGWKEVAKGLTKILIGYAIWVVGYVLGVGLVLLPLIQANFKLESTRMGIPQLWMFYAGLGILSVTGMLSCGIVMGGKWKCMINASERNNCRWLLFVCVASLAMSMALGLLSSLAGLKIQPEFSRGVAGLGRMRFSTVGVVFNLSSVGLCMAYGCTFALFLRSVAQCMDSRWHVRLVDLFLSFFVPLTIASVFLTYRVITGDEQMIKPLLFVGVGWIGCFAFWIYMIASVRRCILRTLDKVKDPMAYSALAPGRPQKRDFSYN